MTTPTILAFQTGRLYTEQGQRIAATLLPNNRIMFLDIDRGIDAVTEDTYTGVSRDRVMNAYDYGKYTMLTENTTGLGYDELKALRDTLRAAAAAVPA